MIDYSFSTKGVHRLYFVNGAVQTSFPAAWTKTLSHSGLGSGNHRDPTPGTLTTSTVKYWNGKYTFTKKGQNLFGYAGVESDNLGTIGTLSPSDYDWPKLLARAEGKMYTKMRGDVDLSVSLGEAGQVTRMLRSAFKLADVIRRIHPKRWASNWLEYQYGWRPLVTDIYQSVEQLRNGHVTGEHRIKVRAGEVWSDSVSTASPVTTFSAPMMRDFSYRYELSTDWRLNDGAVNHLANLTSMNPASIAWELTPFSFVVDWIVDIGGYLRAAENFLLYRNQFVRGYATKSARLQSRIQVTGSDDVYSIVDLNASSTVGYKSRGVYSPSWPIRPRFKIDLGWQRLLSAASLIATHIQHRG
jgi:hypothetical protein